jgi:oligopeptide/dipeptide ABC transporter ATP-binding protein
MTLLRVRHLSKHFPVRRGAFGAVAELLKAVDDISMDLEAGETLGLVGESGCGKTTAGRAILRLVEPSDGEIHFAGHDLMRLGSRELRALRPHMQIIFQDPYASLNPRMNVSQMLEEAMRVHAIEPRANLSRRVDQLLDIVGLSPRYRSRYPHEFSGGQRQRIGIARALSLKPKLIVCDEAVSALDVSIQAQILNLLKDLQSEFGLAYLFISHDLNVVRYMANRIAVMYLGQIVEQADATTLFTSPRHPYTQALLAANPVPDPQVPHAMQPLRGDVPSPLEPPRGCAFHPRCPRVMATCDEHRPPLLDDDTGTTTHSVRCHLYTA